MGWGWNSGPTVTNSYGTASDLWGETLVASDVNASGFGVAISASILVVELLR